MSGGRLRPLPSHIELSFAVIPTLVLPDGMLITSKGQVTIPQRIRNRYGLKPGTAVEFVTDGGKVRIVPKRRARNAVDDWLHHATGALKGKATTARIMKLTRGDDR